MIKIRLVPAPYYENDKTRPYPSKMPRKKWPYDPRGSMKAFYVVVESTVIGRVTENEHMSYKLSGRIRYGDTYTYYWEPEIVTREGWFKGILSFNELSSTRPSKSSAVGIVLSAAKELGLI